MVKNGEKRDVLLDVLNNVHGGLNEELEALNEIIESQGPGRSETHQSNKKASPKPALKSFKKKTSHYLSRPVCDSLDAAKIDLKNLLPDLPKSNIKKSEITKSNIVDIAVKTILEEYKEKGLQSTLIQELISKSKRR